MPSSFTLLRWLLAACSMLVAAEPPLDADYFAPTDRVTGLLYENPENVTCWVLMGIRQTSTTAPIRQQPSATQVPTMVMGDVTLQVQNWEDFAYEDGFELSVEVPLDVLIFTATDAAIGIPTMGHNGTAAYPLLSSLPLEASGNNTQFVNTTVVARTQDFTPRSVFVNGSRCALALEGFKPSDLPAATNLAPILSPILAGLPPVSGSG